MTDPSATFDRDPPGFPPIAELVPHEPPMLLVDELLEWSEAQARVGAKVRAGGPFVVDGHMPASVCLEYMAQAIAACQGMHARRAGLPVRMGVLLGSRELSLSVDSLAVGDVLEITVVREYAEDNLGRYACALTREGQPIARATINVMALEPATLAGRNTNDMNTNTDTDTDTDSEERP